MSGGYKPKATMGPQKGLTRYQKQQKGKMGQSSVRLQGMSERSTGSRRESQDRERQRKEGDDIDANFGFGQYKEGPPRIGWLLNYLPITVPDDAGNERSGLDLYFIDREGGNFKVQVYFRPYFFVDCSDDRRLMELQSFLQKRIEGCVVETMDKEDLDMPNHLSGKKHKFLKLSFNCVSDLMEAKQVLRPIVQRNQKASETNDYVDDETLELEFGSGKAATNKDVSAFIADIREYDVPYTMRASIDLDIRVGAWFVVTPDEGSSCCTVEWQRDMLELGQPTILAFDIECEKAPLKFPDAEKDRIYMISYMVGGQGYLITNREVVTADITDFEYTPLPQYPGPFEIFNERSEKDLLEKFVKHVRELRPHVIVTYNGDFFDWPYVQTRCTKHGISLYRELGVRCGSGMEGEYTGRCMVHLDAFAWVNRDSYLPQGSRGLKAVTKNKLHYDPVEVDPEDMLREARERPEHMASYSVSDAVATYYLYTTYVHNFIFSLSTVIPLASEDVLRKGSGTLCESLLMVEAYKCNVICPNKQTDDSIRFHNNKLLESETYIGGHVECLESGVFRSDIPNTFNMVPAAFDELIDHIDRDLTFALEVENGVQRCDITNYDEVRQQIVEQLEMLRDRPDRVETPRIYHLDVAAMYPNIILTNRLQPSAMVSVNDCAACEFNQSVNGCKRQMEWTWRGDVSPAGVNEFNMVQNQLMLGAEKFAHPQTNEDVAYSELPPAEQVRLARQRFKNYSQRAYKRVKDTKIEQRVDTVCMRENPFYVNTVRAFRDRRYEYKLATKQWKKKKGAAEKAGDAVARKEAANKEVLMDSLQLAHKCILNSFYGYVMRKGARWKSMQMAGIVTRTGAELIKQARELVERIGRPLELDTDGIWCILPSSFPEGFKFKHVDGSSYKVDYPCAMLNADVHANYTNHQYQDQIGPKRYDAHSECSIYFELDGPYKAMVLPASPEEGKLLKKKYVVFEFDGSIAELKGFELKRRGELEVVKAFQEEVFDKFLSGNSLQTCYDAVGKIANSWLNVLDSQGIDMDDEELLGYISERKTISKTLEEYEDRKATSLTTARRLSEFLGDETVKDKGLSCNLILARYPEGAPVTDRAIPVDILKTDPAMRRHYLRKWLKLPLEFDCTDFRTIVDWNYYKERLGKSIQKIVTIPAGTQGIQNPCPRVAHPVWLLRRLKELTSGKRQTKINKLFGPKVITDGAMMMQGMTLSDVSHAPSGQRKRAAGGDMPLVQDMEDFGSPGGTSIAGQAGAVARAHRFARASEAEEAGDSAVSTTAVASPEKVTVPKVAPMMTTKPETDGDMQEWLNARKQSWRQRRRDIKTALRENSRPNAARDRALQRLKEAEMGVDAQGRKKVTSVTDLVRNAALAITYKSWQVVEICESDSPGRFIVWAMTGAAQLQKVTVTIPRTLLVNCRGKRAERASQELGGRKVHKTLPHSRQEHALYQVHVPESKYARNERNLALFLADPEVEGVYERGTPLWMRFVKGPACVMRLAGGQGAQHEDGSYPLSALDGVDGVRAEYLTSESANLRHIFLYRAKDNSGRGLLSLFIVDRADPQKPRNAKAYVWFSRGQRRSRRVPDQQPPLQRIFRKKCEELQICEDNITVKFTAVYTRTMDQAARACADRVATYIRERHGPTIAIGMGCGDAKAWRRLLPPLSDMPTMAMASCSSDDLFHALNWQNAASANMVQRFLCYPVWLEDRLDCARYVQAPVGNLGHDVTMTMTDITFSRILDKNRHALWMSETQLPDLGGAESDHHGVWSETLTEPVVTEPGLYRTICVDIELHFLAIQAIMESHNLDASTLAGDAVTTGTGDGDASAGGEATVSGVGIVGSYDTACAPAFKLLKAMVTTWVSCVVSHGDRFADTLLTSFYRYICGGGNSLLHDPALHRVVFGLMTKLFKRLVAELRRLGLVVVHADFNRITVNTNKHDVEAAKEHIAFIRNALKKKSLFKMLMLKVKDPLWHALLYKDPENYGGIECESEEQEEKGENEEGENEGDGDMVLDEEAVVPAAPLVTSPQPSSADKENIVSPVAGQDCAGKSKSATTSETGTSSSAKKKPKAKAITGFFAAWRTSPNDDAECGDKPSRVATAIPDNMESQAMDTYSQEPSSDDKWETEVVDESLEVDEEWSRDAAGLTAEEVDEQRDNDMEEQDNYDFLDFSDMDRDGSDNDDLGVALTGRGSMSARIRQKMKERERRATLRSQLDGVEADLLPKAPDAGARVMDDEEKADDDYLSVEEELRRKFGFRGKWNIAAFLPEPIARDFFLEIIADVLVQYDWRYRNMDNERKEKMQELYSSGNSMQELLDDLGGEEAGMVVDGVPLDDEAIESKLVGQMKSYCDKELHEYMLQCVKELRDVLANVPADEIFPKRAGSHLSLTDPLLEFVKAVTHVLGLDTVLSDEVAGMRRVLLRDIKIREFSDDANFVDPCLSYVLPDVICKFCLRCRDVDLLRDDALTAALGENKTRASCWKCPGPDCDDRIDLESIENRLIQDAERLSTSFLLQDLRCPKTHRVSSRLTTATSALSVPLQLDMSREELTRKLETLRRVAEFHEFPMLLETVEGLM